jgi:acylphosphatase
VDNRRVARRFLVSGMVQGVGYRYFAQHASAGLNLNGYAKNLRDGRVEVYAIGSEAALAELRRQLERGPESASVSGVSESDADVDAGFDQNFSIEYDR